ncbi:MAG: valine--tRNA ligase [Clostridia bacterium]|nr:MAG: valine--tRNA ligase [Clostridia bacterium]
MVPVYDPRGVEKKWYAYWEENGFFHQEVDEEKKPFCIVMPPPNVTGSLHLGHALDNTLQDILVRWRRMQGYNVLWVPGTDHAGIATQARVEENLAQEGLSRYDLGREKFLERVWAWKEQYGSHITQQLRLLGASCDWQRERFTMDAGCSRAVREVFVHLYEKGHIYRGDYMVNWCPKCHTVISDIEVEHEDEAGKLYHLRYPLGDGQGYVVVATTRPETMLGDTAVAVHPEDGRYRGLAGRRVRLPLVNREIPIIADPYVDPTFGTGAVKITPAHDPNDFEVARRHGLPQVKVIGLDGKMTAEAGNFQGLDRYECRREVLAELDRLGLVARVEDHQHSVGHCYRCGTVIEPLVSRQWFVRMQPLAEPAAAAVVSGRIRFIPDRFTKVYLEWLANIRDWCISRQLWWGHRIPVWYCADCGETIVAREDPASCPQCGSAQLEQDPDVLDTWFSSALWPFSTLGWPERTPELDHFYPTSVLVTGRDIIFFWVARMIFMAMEFMPDVPFREVFIHGLIRDAQGRKMSKSLGNGVDPVEVIAEYGADSLRFMLVTGNTPGNDLRFDMARVESARNFANKIWNAARLALMHLEGFTPDGISGPLEPADRWIISRLQRTITAVTEYLEAYEVGEAARALYDFIWDELCDWYLEMVKPRLYGGSEAEAAAARQVIHHVFTQTLQLLHPFMPFITEEIWQRFPHQGPSIMVSSWPQAEGQWVDPRAEQDVELVMGVVRAVRNLRSAMRLAPKQVVRVVVQAADTDAVNRLAGMSGYIERLAGTRPLEFIAPEAEAPPQAVTAVAAGVQVFMPLGGLVDVEAEKARLGRELAAVEKELSAVSRKLANRDFLHKAPAEVVAKEKAKKAEFLQQRETLQERLRTMGEEQ